MDVVIENTDLGCLDDQALVKLFKQRRANRQFLQELNAELKARHSDLATELHWNVAIALRAQSKAASSAPELTSGPQPVQVRDWLEAFVGARQMPRPDGRALYRCRMTDDEYAELKRILPQLAASGRLSEPDRHAGAVFLAYCAEWFRRESKSTFLCWNDPEPLIFPEVPYPSKQQLTILGLHYWRRNLRMNGSTREFLLTAALEGGFPVRILAEGGRGWLKEYLRSIMRRAISHQVDTPDEILALAREESVQMRKSYRHDDFIALCSSIHLYSLG